MRGAALLGLLALACHDAEVVDQDPGPCVPATCETRGYDCGTAWDGCTGTIECGTCAEGFVCGGASPNVCSCEPTTCQDLLVNCGTIDDGCGGTVACGDCAAPAGCGDGGDALVCALPAGLACDEDGFCWENPSPVPFEPFSMHVRRADDIWAVGHGGQIRHFDGTTWGSTPSGTGVLLRGVWAPSASEAWAVGLEGTLLHWDGAAWTPVDLGTSADLTDVGGRDAGDVWVVGVNVSFRWDGESWSPATPSTPVLYHLHVAGADQAFATGGGRVWEWTPSAWVARTPSDSDFTLNGIAGRSASEIYAVGYEDCGSVLDPDRCELVYRRDGATTWSRIDTADEGPIQDIYATADQIVALREGRLSVLAGAPLPGQPDGPLATGGGAADVQVVLGPLGQPSRLTGGAWRSELYGPADDLRAGGRVGDAVWVAGGGRVHAWRGSGLVETVQPPGEVLSIQGRAGDQVWAVIDAGGAHGVLHRFDGAAWTPVDAATDSVAALWSNGIDSYAVGDAIYLRFADQLVRVHRSDGSAWRAIDGSTDGSAWAVGSLDGAGLVARRVGGVWTEEILAQATELCAVMMVAPDDVWVAGERDGTALVARWYNGGWSTAELGEGRACDLGRVDGTQVALAGGRLWRRSGPSWNVWLDHPAGDFHGLEVDAAGGLWLFGDRGALVYRGAP
ncbi:MAG TPA: hypothetical protein VFU21_00860 [Kofleriaceae bacterium]|nr:hypothetical protein [Kofleriaceae bacterium]